MLLAIDRFEATTQVQMQWGFKRFFRKSAKCGKRVLTVPLCSLLVLGMEKKTKRLTKAVKVRLDSDQLARLEARSAETSLKVSTLARLAIIAWLAKGGA